MTRDAVQMVLGALQPSITHYGVLTTFERWPVVGSSSLTLLPPAARYTL